MTTAELEARIAELEAAVRWLIDTYDRNTCTHEETHRGGVLWTICDQCGMQWADDRGGFVPHVEPKELTAARELLCAFPPKTEEVTERAWKVVRDDGYCTGVYESLRDAEVVAEAFTGHRHIIELTGTYQRPIPAKVKKRISLTKENMIKYPSHPIPDHAVYFAEWEETP